MRNLFLLLFWVSALGWAQEDARVYFADKPNAQAYFDAPLTMLTQRALDRRIQQNIPLSLDDVPVESTYIQAISNVPGITYKAQSKWMNCIHVRGSVAAIQGLMSFPFVERIVFANPQLNAKSTSQAPTVQPKSMALQTTYSYGNAQNQVTMLNTHLLHQQNHAGAGKIIAVLDSGFQGVDTAPPFQSLFSQNRYLGGYSYVSQSTNVFDLHNHGTLVLSSMAAVTDGTLVGTAPTASYYLFITEDVMEENPVEESYWVQAAEEADRLGCDIISSSLGYYGYDNPAYSYSYSNLTGNQAFASQGANKAFSKGMVVVVSAGNSGNSTAPYVAVPAEATHALAIGAVDSMEFRASFSSIGPTFDGRVKPDLMARGVGAAVCTPQGDFTYVSGTSLSCPIISGSIACFWAAAPQLTNQQVVDLVKQSADRFANPTMEYGYGVPDFAVALSNALSVTSFSTPAIKVYPNPFDDFVTFHGDFSEPMTLRVYNAMGQLVRESRLTSALPYVSMGEFPSGWYTYTLYSTTQSFSGKLIKS